MLKARVSLFCIFCKVGLYALLSFLKLPDQSWFHNVFACLCSQEDQRGVEEVLGSRKKLLPGLRPRISSSQPPCLLQPENIFKNVLEATRNIFSSYIWLKRIFRVGSNWATKGSHKTQTLDQSSGCKPTKNTVQFSNQLNTFIF